MLMPWLGKYRRLARPESGDDVSAFGILELEPAGGDSQLAEMPSPSPAASASIGHRTLETEVADLQRENRRLKDQLYVLRRIQTERRRMSS
jgi:hypothetical protein